MTCGSYPLHMSQDEWCMGNSEKKIFVEGSLCNFKWVDILDICFNYIKYISGILMGGGP